MTGSNATSGRTDPRAGRTSREASSSSTAERFSLSGPSPRLDPRVNAYRADVADIALAGRVIASHYARPLIRGCGAHPVMVRTIADASADSVSELLPGENFAVLEYLGGWAWGYCEADHVVGFVEAIELVAPVAGTHIVCEKQAPVSPDRSLGSPVLATLPMGSRLAGSPGGAFLCSEYGCVPISHLCALDEPSDDPVLVAERLIGAPWRAGGRTCAGIDSAGLVQLALILCGVKAPRFADQLATLGQEVPPGSPRRRGDLLVWDGQAALMIDDLMMIHACREAGKVTAQSAATIADRDAVCRRLDI